MNETAYLLCEIISVGNREAHIRSWLEDDSTFEVKVPRHLVRMIEQSQPQQGYLEVSYSGETKDRRASITLPRPSLQYGAKVTVNTKHLDRP